jgi:RHS repeat-associated protein
MMMPGRKYSVANTNYRYGFNGQENDNELRGIGNSINFELRMHDPRLGRFLSLDPLTKHFPGNSPYAFAENRVIDGIELEGAEYVHYYVFLEGDGKTLIQNVKVEDFTGMSNEQLQRTHGMGSAKFYKKYSDSFGKEGRGVKYSYFIKDSRDGRFMSGGSSFEKSGEAFSHGLYYGAGATSQQGDRPSIRAGTKGNSFLYNERPIDEVDGLARKHDMTYEKDGAKDFHSDPSGLSADIAFVEGLTTYVTNASKSGYKDAITGRTPSTEAIKSANIAIKAFKILIANKIDNLIKQSNQIEDKK